MPKIKFSKVRDVKSPERGTDKSAGIDFFVPNFEKPFRLKSHSDLLIPSGIKANIPEGYMLMGADKSGVATSKWAVIGASKKPKDKAFHEAVIIGAKIVDEDYQGEIHIHLINTGNTDVMIDPGMKIAQFILVPVLYAELEEVEADKLYESESQRGIGGFGSTDAPENH